MGNPNYELEHLENAIEYQKWVYETVLPFLGDRILEIGAGTGNISQWLPLKERLICTEGHLPFLETLKWRLYRKHGETDKIATFQFDVEKDFSNPAHPIWSLDIDTVISFNFLEHVKNDGDVVSNLVRLLKKSQCSGPKRIIFFVPAHQWAYGAMDENYGHFRRYDRKDFVRLQSSGGPFAALHLLYFNIFGLIPWFFLGRVLRRKLINPSSIVLFEKLCPYFKKVDHFIHRILKIPFGQSVCAVMVL